MQREFHVYILTNWSRTLYIGVTNDLPRRIDEHLNKRVPGFTARYQIDQLVYYEAYTDIRDAIAREKQLKGWTRAKRIALMEATNPAWNNLNETLLVRETG